METKEYQLKEIVQYLLEEVASATFVALDETVDKSYRDEAKRDVEYGLRWAEERLQDIYEDKGNH